VGSEEISVWEEREECDDSCKKKAKKPLKRNQRKFTGGKRGSVTGRKQDNSEGKKKRKKGDIQGRRRKHSKTKID